MQIIVDECVNVFCDLTVYDKNQFKPAPTPFTDESKDNSGVTDEEEGKIGDLCQVRNEGDVYGSTRTG